MVYKKKNSRITVKIIDGYTNELLMEIPNRNSVDINEVLTDNFITALMKQKSINLDCVRILIAADFFKE